MTRVPPRPRRARCSGRRLAPLLSSALLACALLLSAAPTEADDRLQVVTLTPGVHAVIGSTNEASPHNGGEVGNAGFIVGAEATVVVNTGTSYQHGRRLIELAERVGGRPVALAIITQPLPEFILGSAAFTERGIPLLAHEAAARLIMQRCEQCLSRLQRLLGEDAMRGTRVVEPARRIAGSTRITVGGRSLELLHFGWGATPGDLAVFDPASGVLFAGALVSAGRVPELRDADVAGWLTALDALAATPFSTLVPGYGRGGDSGALAATRHYLATAAAHVRQRLDEGASLHECVQGARTDPAFAAFSGWALFEASHTRNVQKLYLEFEAEAFRR